MTRVPLLSIALTPRTPSDAERLAHGLQVLAGEDPTISTRTLPTGAVVVGGMGELQLEIIVARLAREFDVSATLGRPQIGYTETVTREADGEMKYATFSPRQYAHVKVTVYPRDRGAGNEFVNNTVGDAVPEEYVPAVEEGVGEALETGVLAGYPVQDVKVVLYDGSWHDLDSSAPAFQRAAELAVCDALRKAEPIVLEPMMHVELDVPLEFTEAVVRSLYARKGHFVKLIRSAVASKIGVILSLSNLFGYSHELRDLTSGRGAFTTAFERYEPVRKRNRGEDENRGGLGVREPLHPRPAPRSGSIALPLDDL